MTFKDYVKKKANNRQISDNNKEYVKDLKLFFKAMTPAEKSRLITHKSTIAFNPDIRDLKDIKEHYSLSWNEIRLIILRYC